MSDQIKTLTDAELDRELTAAMEKFESTMIANMEDLEPEIADMVSRRFWELI